MIDAQKQKLKDGLCRATLPDMYRLAGDARQFRRRLRREGRVPHVDLDAFLEDVEKVVAYSAEELKSRLPQQ